MISFSFVKLFVIITTWHWHRWRWKVSPTKGSRPAVNQETTKAWTVYWGTPCWSVAISVRVPCDLVVGSIGWDYAIVWVVWSRPSHIGSTTSSRVQPTPLYARIILVAQWDATKQACRHVTGQTYSVKNIYFYLSISYWTLTASNWRCLDSRA